MTIELVVNDSYENVQAAARATLTELGFAIDEQAMPAGNRVKTCMWTGEKGNKILAMFLGFIFKMDRVNVIMTAYQDGSTALAVHEGGTVGGNVVSGLGGGLVGSAADEAMKGKAMSEKMAAFDAKLKDKLGAKIAYLGRIKDGAIPVMV
ncbi:MAG: hypothetical protein HY908_13990 [Myxococcales bacterium]|nr:hypothetical protein [Myxococcales bacterium]